MEIIDGLALVSSVIAIIAIVMLAIIGGRYLYSRRRGLKTAGDSENIGQPEKPEIVVFLRPHAASVQCLMLCIENIGTGTAHNLRFGTGASRTAPFLAPSSNFGDISLLKKNTFLENEIRCFGPGQTLEQFLISLIGGLPEELKQPLQISVTYTDALNHPYEHRYTLDFGEFESLGHSNSAEEKLTSELSPLLHTMQTGFSQIAESIERLKLTQISKPERSETPPQEEEKPLSPNLQQFVALYNAGDNAKLQQNYKSPWSLYVSNETERFQNPSEPPAFKTKSNGSLIAYAIDSEDLYAVIPFLGCILQNKLYNSGAFGKVFECPGFDPEHRYHVKVLRPAFFKRDNEKWALQEKGKLELKEKDH
ncbi:MAG: hypothetical protein OXD49_10810 [Candidatus Poribacteria bacterium]|nr:hypothetical protein [Candidatus Poribacteria bacterium]